MSRQVTIGGLRIGGGAPVVVQSMAKTPTHEVEATVDQIHQLEAEGCELVRVAVPNRRAARALGRIRPRVVLAKLVASGVCIAAGGSVGREESVPEETRQTRGLVLTGDRIIPILQSICWKLTGGRPYRCTDVPPASIIFLLSAPPFSPSLS